MTKRYIRFGEIPQNERSGIYRGDIKVGEELGVSCYDCICVEDSYRIIFPNIPTQTTCVTLHWLFEEFHSGRLKKYLITGDEIGMGTDNEPLLKNIKVIREL